MQLDTATPQDAPKISRIYQRSWKQAYRGMVPQPYLDALCEDHWTAAFQKWISQGLYTVLIAPESGQPLGAIAFGPSREEAGWGEIQSIYVLPEHWNKGVGKALMQAAIQRLHQNGFSKIYLWVLDQNHRAQQFYQSLGFCPTQKTWVQKIQGAELVDYRYELS